MPEQDQNDPKLLQLVDQMEVLGYFRYVAPERIPRLKSRFMKKPNLWSLEVKRDFPADEWCIAVYGVKDFLREIPALVRKEIIPLKQMQEHRTDEGHWIVANGQRYDLVSSEELRGIESKFDIWPIKTPRAFAFINKLFQDAGSDERIYSMSGGNDHRGHILPYPVYHLFIANGIEGASDLRLYDPLVYL